MFALRQLMQELPVRKIKVQDIMHQTGMTRQSFYYHFQDVYQVLEWELERQVLKPYGYHSAWNFSVWLHNILTELNRDHDFYRKAALNLESNQLTSMILPIIRPNVNMILFGTAAPKETEMTELQSYTAEMLSMMIYQQILNNVTRRDMLSEEELEVRIRFSIDLLGRSASILEGR